MTVCNLCFCWRSRPATCCSTRRRRCYRAVFWPNLCQRCGATHRQHRHSAPYRATISAGHVECTWHHCERRRQNKQLLRGVEPSVWNSRRPQESVGLDNTRSAGWRRSRGRYYACASQQWQTGATPCAEVRKRLRTSSAALVLRVSRWHPRLDEFPTSYRPQHQADWMTYTVGCTSVNWLLLWIIPFILFITRPECSL